MLDRITPPLAQPFTPRHLPPYTTRKLSNGIPVYCLQYGTVDIAEVQLVFKGGAAFEDKPGSIQYMAANLKEGTTSRTGQQLAERLDDFGASISADTDSEFVAVSLSALTKHLSKTLPLLREVIMTPSFPEEDFLNMKHRGLQRMELMALKTSFIARREFLRLTYGDAHPYGAVFGPEELKALTIEDLKTCHQQYLGLGNCFILAVGRFEEEQLIGELETHFGKEPATGKIEGLSHAANAEIVTASGRHYKEQEGMQATLRLGHLGLKRKHDDYYPMIVVNTILGGYFGSRLMKNIREEKGLTYGIYAIWYSDKYSGHFSIQGDVSNDKIELALSEIRKEIQRLIDEPIPEDELTLVKNYLLGKSVSERESPFQLSNLMRYSLAYDISFESLDQKFDIIQNLQVSDIQRLAQQYYHPDQLLEVISGKM